MENQEKLEEMKDVKVEKKDEKLDAEKVQEIEKKLRKRKNNIWRISQRTRKYKSRSNR